jgi:phage baseplate assembly protein W
MAYNAKRIAPVDLKRSTALGVKIPFSYPSAFTSVYTTKDQIRYNIINFLLTNNRERIFYPNFGANLRAQLFENISPENLSSLEQQIAAQIDDRFPIVQVIECYITPQEDSNIITINLTYRLLNSNETDDLVVGIENR